MTLAPLRHVPLSGDMVKITLQGEDGRSLTIDVTEAALRSSCTAILASLGHDNNTWRAIARPVLAARGVTLSQILGPSKEKHVSRARQAVCWSLSQVMDQSGERRWTNMAIARFLGMAPASVFKGARSHAERNGLGQIVAWSRKTAFRPIAERVE